MDRGRRGFKRAAGGKCVQIRIKDRRIRKEQGIDGKKGSRRRETKKGRIR